MKPPQAKIVLKALDILYDNMLLDSMEHVFAFLRNRKIVRAFTKGAQIQVYDLGKSKWVDLKNPYFRFEDFAYRIKTTKKKFRIYGTMPDKKY